MKFKLFISVLFLFTALTLSGCSSKKINGNRNITAEESMETTSEKFTKEAISDTSTPSQSEALTDMLPDDIIPVPEDLSNIDDDYFENEPLNASGKEEMTIYFSNTTCIDSNDALPLQAQIRLVDDTVKFLSAAGYTDTFEVTIMEETFEKTDATTSFICTLDAYPGVQIKISYVTGTGLFDFQTIAWEDLDESQETKQ